MTVPLSMYEQRQLAEIAEHLRVEDPHLARMFAGWSAHPRQPWLLKITVGAIACGTAMVAGVVLSGSTVGPLLAVGTALIVLGVVGLLVAAAVGAWTFRSGRRPVRWWKQVAHNRYRFWPGGEQGYPWVYWGYW